MPQRVHNYAPELRLSTANTVHRLEMHLAELLAQLTTTMEMLEAPEEALDKLEEVRDTRLALSAALFEYHQSLATELEFQAEHMDHLQSDLDSLHSLLGDD